MAPSLIARPGAGTGFYTLSSGGPVAHVVLRAGSP